MQVFHYEVHFHSRTLQSTSAVSVGIFCWAWVMLIALWVEI